MNWGHERQRPIGRDGQLLVLEACLGDALEGGMAGVILDGDAGVGKSTLLRALARTARDRGSTVAIGACLPIPGLPYAPIVQILRTLASPEDVVDGRFPAMAAEIIPRLSARTEASPRGELPQRRSMLFQQFLDVVRAASRPVPLLLGIEDLQWVDADSAELLLYLVRNADDHAGLLVVGTQRSETSPPAATAELLHELRRSPRMTQLAVPPLTDTQAREHVGWLTGSTGDVLDESQVSAIVHLAEGNPFHIEELVRDAGDRRTTVPESLMHLFRDRFVRLPVETRDLLRAAAVAGRRVAPAILHEVLGCSIADLERAVGPALRGGFVRVETDSDVETYAFRHALLREAIVADIPLPERHRLHRRLAEALVARSTELSPASEHTEIAHHWDAAGAAEALFAHVRASELSMQVCAYASAAQHLARALELWRHAAAEGRAQEIDGPEVLGKAATAAYLCGRVGDAVELVREAISRVDVAAEPMRAGMLHAQLAEYQADSTGPESAQEADAQALRLIPSDPPSVERASVLRMVGGRQRALGRYPEAIASLTEALGMARATGSVTIEVQALVNLGVSRCLTGEVTEGLAALEEAQRTAATHAQGIDPVVRFWPAISMVSVLINLSGDLERGVDMAIRSIDASGRLGELRLAGAELTVNLVEALYLLGRWDEVAASIDVLDSQGIDEPISRAYLNAQLARVHASRGAWDEASKRLASARSRADATADLWLKVFVESIAADMGAWRLDLQAVRRATRRGLETVRQDGAAIPALGTELAAAELLWHGTRAEADSVKASARVTPTARQAAIDEAAALARSSRFLAGGTTPYGPKWRARLSTLSQMTDQEAARTRGAGDPDAWRSIVADWQVLGIPYLATYATFRLAQALFERRHRSSAARELVEANRSAEELGAVPLSRQIHELARRSRTVLATASEPAPTLVEPRPDPDAAQHRTQVSLATLSPREHEVAALLADGHTNREIAEGLFVTERTAAAHVSSILGKLGVSRRTEAAALWHRSHGTRG